MQKRKKHFIFVFSEETLLKRQAQKVFEEIKFGEDEKAQTNTFVLPVLLAEDKISYKSSLTWIDVNDNLMNELDQIQNVTSDGNDSASEKLHEAMDSLPFTGNVIDVYIEFSVLDSLRSENSLQLFGALRRLKDWHNAVINFVLSDGCDRSDEAKAVERLLTSSCQMEHLSPGEATAVILGRMLEVLDEVYVPSIPLFYFTGCELQLYPHILLQPKRCLAFSGYLCRLACYHDEKDIPSTGEKYLNTSSWKESILNDITFVQEPEEELLRPYDFIFFLLTRSSDPDTNCSKFCLHVMKSASDISGRLTKHLLMNSILRPNTPSPKTSPGSNNMFSQKSAEDLLRGLPVLNDRVLAVVSDLLQEEQRAHLIEDDPSVSKNLESINSTLAEIQEKVLGEVKSYLPKYCETLASESDLQSGIPDSCPDELLMDSSEWPEKKYLLYQESQRKSISRLRSTDSLVLSSPLQQQEETPPTLDIKHCLTLFQSDGTAVTDGLSPVRKKNTSRSQGKLLRGVSPGITGLQWPDSLDQRAPDIYNKDKKTEKTQDQCSQLCDRYVTKETYSSYSSPVFVVNKNPKELAKYVEELLPKTLRRSPRKAVRRTNKGLQIQTMGVRSSPRKRANKMAEGQIVTQQSPIKKVNKQFSRVVASDSQRRQSLSSIEVKKLQQADSARRKSLTAVQTTGSDKAERRESRSERHKRKLEEIVTDVIQKHGVSPEDPIFKSCIQKLFKVTKIFVMDLPNSQNLRSEMRNIAEGQVKQVVDLEKRKQMK
uniref:Mdm2-binding protein n=1 Tax=Magallana gigas TaxID=29159 RepID=K1RIL5_MAGGI